MVNMIADLYNLSKVWIAYTLYTILDSIVCNLPEHTIKNPWNKSGTMSKHT